MNHNTLLEIAADSTHKTYDAWPGVPLTIAFTAGVVVFSGLSYLLNRVEGHRDQKANFAPEPAADPQAMGVAPEQP
ncbi:MAG: hypothetical protein JWP85_2807 [Rhodoglobus sp.]|nr:hypothetical protein [Rhodoglobus sp.]